MTEQVTPATSQAPAGQAEVTDETGRPATGPADGELNQTELEAQQGEELPDREAMSLVNANLAAPINAAVALNALSDHSVAYADAQQTAPITQKI